MAVTKSCWRRFKFHCWHCESDTKKSIMCRTGVTVREQSGKLYKCCDCGEVTFVSDRDYDYY